MASAFFLLPFATMDPFYYFGLAQAQGSGQNPYLDFFFRINPFASSYSLVRIEGGTMYQPLWLLWNKHLTSLAGGSILKAIFLYKTNMLIFHLANAWLVRKISEEIRTPNPGRTAMLYLMNPLLLFEFLGQAHFDGMMIFFAFLSLWATLKKRCLNAGLTLGLALSIKSSAALLVPFLLAKIYLDSSRKILRPLGTLAICLLVAGAFYWPYWEGMKIFDALRLQSKWIINTPFSGIYHMGVLLREGFSLSFSLKTLSRSLSILFGLCFLFFYRGYLRTYWRNAGNLSSLFWIESIAAAYFLFIAVFLRSFWPWYASWVFSFSVLLKGSANGSRVICAADRLCETALLSYVVPLLFGYWAIDLPALQILTALIVFPYPLRVWFSSR